MKAQLALERTIRSANQKEYDQVIAMVMNESDKGQVGILFPSRLSPAVIAKLKFEGYSVNVESQKETSVYWG